MEQVGFSDGNNLAGHYPRGSALVSSRRSGYTESVWKPMPPPRRIEINERLIVALDVPTQAEARKLVADLNGLVSFFKVGLELQLAAGPDFVRQLVAEGKKVFLDSKFLDVPEQVKRAVAQAVRLGTRFLTVHESGKTVQAAVEASRGSTLQILAVTLLTSFDAADVQGLGFDCSPEELVLHRAKKAMDAGCQGVIASGLEARKIRELCGERLIIVSPGIRPAGTSTDDHQRSSTPANAIRSGADYLVVGRPIRDAADPRKAAQDILEEMEAAWKA